MIDANISNTDLTGCRVCGISAWDVKIRKDTKQQNLIITRSDEPNITVDNIEVAQFIYLLLNNGKIRDVVDTIAKKAVLLLDAFLLREKKFLMILKTSCDGSITCQSYSILISLSAGI